MPDDPPEEPPEDEPGGIVEDGMSELLAPPVPLVPLVPPDSDGMPVELPVEPPLVPAPEPPPVMPAQAPSSRAQAMGNIHLVIEHSR